MVARARRGDETFEQYRKNLIHEKKIDKIRFKGFALTETRVNRALRRKYAAFEKSKSDSYKEKKPLDSKNSESKNEAQK